MAVVIAVFVVPRAIPIPAALEPYGFYPKNSEGNTREWASLPAKYVDQYLCYDCHQAKYGILENSEHSSVTCENCHGPGRPHIEEGAKLTIDLSRPSCGACHARVLARPSDFPQVNLAEHGGISACVSCHNPHNPGGGPMLDIPHTLDGHNDCLACHNREGTRPFPADHIGNNNDVCLACHRSK